MDQRNLDELLQTLPMTPRRMVLGRLSAVAMGVLVALGVTEAPAAIPTAPRAPDTKATWRRRPHPRCPLLPVRGRGARPVRQALPVRKATRALRAAQGR